MNKFELKKILAIFNGILPANYIETLAFISFLYKFK